MDLPVSTGPLRAAEAPSLPEQIADKLDREIAIQLLPKGARLAEVQLAERLGVARSSVREALRLLASRGGIALSPGRGAVVVGYSVEQLADAMAVSAALMGLAGRAMAHEARPSALADITRLAREVAALGGSGRADPSEFAARVGSFYAAIVIGSGSEQIRAHVSSITRRAIWAALWEEPCDFLTHARQRKVIAQVSAAAKAILDGDGDAAEREIRSFNEGHREVVVREVARRWDLTCPPGLLPLALGGPAPAAERNVAERLERIEARLAALSQPAKGRGACLTK